MMVSVSLSPSLCYLWVRCAICLIIQYLIRTTSIGGVIVHLNCQLEVWKNWLLGRSLSMPRGDDLD